MSKYRCPVCQGVIYINRIDDAETLVSVDDNGELKELSCRSDGSISVYCKENNTHVIPQELQEELIDIYYESYA